MLDNTLAAALVSAAVTIAGILIQGFLNRRKANAEAKKIDNEAEKEAFDADLTGAELVVKYRNMLIDEAAEAQRQRDINIALQKEKEDIINDFFAKMQQVRRDCDARISEVSLRLQEEVDRLKIRVAAAELARDEAMDWAERLVARLKAEGVKEIPPLRPSGKVSPVPPMEPGAKG